MNNNGTQIGENELIESVKLKQRAPLAELLAPILEILKTKIRIVDYSLNQGEAEATWLRLPSRVCEVHRFVVDEAECERRNSESKSQGKPYQFHSASLWVPPENRNCKSNSCASSTSHICDESKAARFLDLRTVKSAGGLSASKPSQAMGLDQWCDSKRISDLDFVRIGRNEPQIEILESGAQCLKRVLGIESEVAFIPSVIGAPLWTDVDTYLRGKGLQYIDIISSGIANRQMSPIHSPPGERNTEGCWPRAQSLSGQMLWFKDPIAQASLISNEKVIKLACIAECYGYIEVAFELLTWLHAERLVVENSPLAEVLEQTMACAAEIYQVAFSK